MKTVTIKIRDSKVLKLIHDLEDLDLIQILDSNEETATKLSTRLSGSLSQEQAEKMHKELKQMRGQ